MKENSIKNERSSIEEDIILLKDFIEGNFKRDKLENYKGSYKMGYFYYKNIQQALEHILSDYKRVLKENEILKEEKEQAWEEWNNLEQGSYETEQKIKQQIKKLQKENKEVKIKNNAIKRESEAYVEHMIRLDNELNLEKEKSKYEWIRQNCLSQELVNKLYIPVQKVKDKIEELKQKAISYGPFIDKDESFNIESKISILQELLEGRK